MINRLDPRLSGYGNLSTQPQRPTGGAEQGGSIFRQALAQELVETPPQRPVINPQQMAEARGDVAERPILPPATPRVNNVNAMAAERAKMMRQLEPMIHEVRQIAEDVGFIDVSSENVLKAYQSGQSFLADYRV